MIALLLTRKTVLARDRDRDPPTTIAGGGPNQCGRGGRVVRALSGCVERSYEKYFFKKFPIFPPYVVDSTWHDFPRNCR